MEQFANNAITTLVAPAAAEDTVIEVTSGALFPDAANGIFRATLIGLDENGNEAAWEIVKCTARTGGVLTVERAQEGTAAQAWAAGTRAELRLTAGALSDALQAIESKQATLVSGANIKTVNGQVLLGAGNIEIRSGVGVTLSGDPSPYVTQEKTYTITNYSAFSEYVVQVSAGTVSLAGDTITFTAPPAAGAVTLTVTMDDVPTEFVIDAQAAGVQTPTVVSPANGATDQGGSVTLTGSAFAWYGLEDTQKSRSYRVATDQAMTNIIASNVGDTVNLLNWTVSGLSTSQEYWWQMQDEGNSNGLSEWSAPVKFTTKATFGGLVGTPGGQGFGVGEYPAELPSGFSAMAGTSDKASANYGNYQYSDGSVMVFVPRFYYRIGNASSPRYATYGANAIDVVGIETFADEAAANAAGYALHRAFKDGGAVKPGFFIDKYLASRNGTTSCKSVALGVPISLTTTTTYTRSSGMTGCTGILADAVVLARSRGAGVFNVASIFMYDALAKLALAHGQAATSATHCAWYDAAGTTNFPKGCNNSALADANDTGVTFTSAGDSGNANKPKTGSASSLAKTTHNGQACGVTDVNGAMYQVMLGITQAGASATDTTAITTGDAYVLKESVALASLTDGFGGATDAWGTAANLATNYDAVTGFLPWGATTGWDYFGNGSNAVFSGATSGTDYLRSCCGIAATTGMSAAGTNQFGNDGNYRYGRANLFPYASGVWNGAAVAGVFCRGWSVGRSSDITNAGFRCAAYGN
ncbi:hypothetical protein [Thauera aromatica]|uniref:Phage tail fiber protein n=1 Tax=Thauera aromatica K172 TaxID=44139 RepID=A0A2R4BNW2_THAAR|nr:hypothetical protein [Thauera aromatica]AVR89015.1 Phage tail fiber protein [Thauera aromatica K172]